MLSKLIALLLSLFSRPAPQPSEAPHEPAPQSSAPSGKGWIDYCRPLTEHFEQCYLIAYCDPASPLAKELQRNGKWLTYLRDRSVANGAPYDGLSGAPWTCGWGSTGPDINSKTVFSQAQADARLDIRLNVAGNSVDKLCQVPLQPNEKAALVDFAYNVGEGNLSSSTMLKYLNQKNFPAAMQEILKWNKAQGKEMEGLNRRRRAEKTLFETGAWSP